MANREIEARLKISAIDRTGQVLANLGKRLEGVSKNVDGINRHMGLLSRATSLALGYFTFDKIKDTIQDAVVDFAALERRMNRIGITADASAAETKAAFDTIQNVAKDLGVPLDQAVNTLDTLVSSGKSLKESMDFLPSVLATAQATGAAGDDIANTALKVSDALKIRNSELQHAFDIMVTGGKAGQFELKDMAQYIPSLANSFATLGYNGEDGLKHLIAILQTLREDTGDASSAATNAANIFGKMYSQETATKFKKFGIDLRAEMDAAKKSGEDAVSAFVRISKEALKGDLSKLPLLFTDQQFREGMQSLITSPDSLKKFFDILNGTKVDGTVFRDLNRVLGDTQTSIDQLSSSWQKLRLQLGEKSANVLVPAMSYITKFLSDSDALGVGDKMLGEDQALKKNTEDEFKRRFDAAGIDKISPEASKQALVRAKMALGRGEIKNLFEFIDKEVLRVDAKGALRRDYGRYVPGKGPQNPLETGERQFPLDKDNAPITAPIPRERPGAREIGADRLQDAYRQARGFGRDQLEAAQKTMSETDYGRNQALDAFMGDHVEVADIRRHMARKKKTLLAARMPEIEAYDAARERMQRGRDEQSPTHAQPFSLLNDRADAFSASLEASSQTLKQGADEGSQKLAQGGEDAKAAVVSAAQEFSRIISSAASQLASQLANVKINVNAGATQNAAPAKVNANVGKTNKFVTNPTSVYHGPK